LNGSSSSARCRAAEAREVLASLERRARDEYVSPYQMALVHVGLGEQETALCSLERALEMRSIDLSGMKADPRFAPLAAEPRLTALLGRMNLD